MAFFTDALKRAWNAFTKPSYTNALIDNGSWSVPSGSASLSIVGRDRTIVTALYNRVAIDVAAIPIRHCMTDSDGLFIDNISDELNNRLTGRANIDQTSRDFILELVLTMLDHGTAVVVPTYASKDPQTNEKVDIYSMRVGVVTQWFPQHVELEVYNDISGRREKIIKTKESVAIINNPLYQVMNQPNSTLQRLIRKLSMLDAVDEQSSNGKLDLIIQLPYVVKSEARKAQAEARRKDLENQLHDSKYGVAYADATEKVTQLNRSVENNLLNQVQYLTAMLYGQLGFSEAVANGTAKDDEMTNYYNRTLEPIISAICDSLSLSFISKTAWKDGERVVFFRDPFRLVSINTLATVFDLLSRNSIMSANEARAKLGLKASSDPGADTLMNKNMPIDQTPIGSLPPGEGSNESEYMDYPNEGSEESQDQSDANY